MSVRRQLASILPLLFVAIVIGMPAGTGAHAMVIAKCAKKGIVGSASVDPIAARGARVSAHQHDFIGNETLLRLPDRERATYAELVNQPTSCNIATDSAAYWAPTLYVDGGRLKPFRMEAYYRAWNHRVTDTAKTTKPFPADTRMVAGNSMATSPAQMDTKNVFWSCGLRSSKPGTRNHFATPQAANCAAATGRVFLTVAYNFPSCWDGQLNRHDVDGETSDFNGNPMSPIQQHFAYRKGSSCPAGFPIHVPAVGINASFDYHGDGRNVTLSSGPGYTAHADFFNAWPVDAMKKMVHTCIDTSASESLLHQGAAKALCGAPLFGN